MKYLVWDWTNTPNLTERNGFEGLMVDADIQHRNNIYSIELSSLIFGEVIQEWASQFDVMLHNDDSDIQIWLDKKGGKFRQR